MKSLHERAVAYVEEGFGIGKEAALRKLRRDAVTRAMFDATIGGVASLIGEIDRLKEALGNIQLAAYRGAICDDVAWYDKHETLFDYIDGVLDPKGDKALRDLFLAEPPIPDETGNWYEIAAYYRAELEKVRKPEGEKP